MPVEMLLEIPANCQKDCSNGSQACYNWSTKKWQRHLTTGGWVIRHVT